MIRLAAGLGGLVGGMVLCQSAHLSLSQTILICMLAAGAATKGIQWLTR